MLDQNLPVDETQQTTQAEIEDLFVFPIVPTEPKNALSTQKSIPLAPTKIRLIFFLNPDEERIPRLPKWLHEFIGWGVFLVILAAFLGIQIYFNRLLNGSLNQIILFLSVIAEIRLLWFWDQYWY